MNNLTTMVRKWLELSYCIQLRHRVTWAVRYELTVPGNQMMKLNSFRRVSVLIYRFLACNLHTLTAVFQLLAGSVLHWYTRPCSHLHTKTEMILDEEVGIIYSRPLDIDIEVRSLFRWLLLKRGTRWIGERRRRDGSGLAFIGLQQGHLIRLITKKLSKNRSWRGTFLPLHQQNLRSQISIYHF